MVSANLSVSSRSSLLKLYQAGRQGDPYVTPLTWRSLKPEPYEHGGRVGEYHTFAIMVVNRKQLSFQELNSKSIIQRPRVRSSTWQKCDISRSKQTLEGGITSTNWSRSRRKFHQTDTNRGEMWVVYPLWNKLQIGVPDSKLNWGHTHGLGGWSPLMYKFYSTTYDMYHTVLQNVAMDNRSPQVLN